MPGVWRTIYYAMGWTYPKDVWLEQQRWYKYNMLQEIERKVKKDCTTKPSQINALEGFKEVKPHEREITDEIMASVNSYKKIKTKRKSINDKYVKR